MSTLRGFCAPNDQRAFTREELETVRLGRFTSAKLFWYHDRDNVAQLRGLRAPADPSRLLPAYNGVQHFMGRWPDLAPGDKLEPHIERVWEAVRRFYPVITRWQTFNEPNVPYIDGGWWVDAWPFQFYMRETITAIERLAREHGLTGLEWCLGPLAYPPKLWPYLNLWRQALTTRPDKDQRIKALHEYHRYACANSYWQYPGKMLDGSYGMNWGDVQNWTGLPVIVAEWGYSGYLLTPEWTDRPTLTMPEVHRNMLEMYPAYTREVHRRGVVADYVFQVGGTQDWRGLALPLPVAARMGELQL